MSSLTLTIAKRTATRRAASFGSVRLEQKVKASARFGFYAPERYRLEAALFCKSKHVPERHFERQEMQSRSTDTTAEPAMHS